MTPDTDKEMREAFEKIYKTQDLPKFTEGEWKGEFKDGSWEVRFAGFQAAYPLIPSAVLEDIKAAREALKTCQDYYDWKLGDKSICGDKVLNSIARLEKYGKEQGYDTKRCDIERDLRH